MEGRRAADRACPDPLCGSNSPHRDSLERDLGARAGFTGALSGRELAAAYRRADFFVFPSKHDTFG